MFPCFSDTGGFSLTYINYEDFRGPPSGFFAFSDTCFAVCYPKKPLLIDVRFLPIITITNYIMFIAISSSSEYEGASIWNMQKKIFGRHKAQNLKQSNLLLVQKIYPYITFRKTAFPCKSFWRHILYWFFKVILLS